VKLEARFIPDPDLLWVAEGYDSAVDRIQKRSADLVFLGDSCTAMGTYPTLLVDRLEGAYPTARLRATKLAVTGWSTYQGLRPLERDVAKARPGIVTFYFGWNDHWVGFGIEDKQLHPLRVSGLPWLSRLRTVQLLSKALVAWRVRTGADRPNRVSPADFRENLRAMARISREHGIVPVFITAPTSHEPGREPEYLAERFLRDVDELVPLQQGYVEIVRQVAAGEGAVLCDTARAFAALPAEWRRTRLFARDGIHLRPAGQQKLAELLFECFQASGPVRAVLEARARDS
jgi:lysophospholipase L1-like esterase